MGGETAGNAVLEVRKRLSAPIGRQFMYLYNYNFDFHNLKKEAGKLKDARDEVKAKVVAAENNGEKIKQTVKDWLGKVDSIIEETDKLIQENIKQELFQLDHLLQKWQESMEKAERCNCTSSGKRNG